MRVIGIMIATLLWLTLCATSWSANSVVVESKAAPAGAAGVQIRIRITNDVPLRGIIIPLDIRKVTPGAIQPFITDLAMSFDERLVGSVLSDIIVTNQYEERMHYCPERDCIGYDDPIVSAPGESHPVQGTPEGAMFVRMKQFSAPLLPGQDTVGSMVLTVNLTDDLGTFEIDTMCSWRCNEISFIRDREAPYEIIEPEFTKGVFQIACSCPYQGDYDEDGILSALDLGALIDVLFCGRPEDHDPGCPNSRGDLDCDGLPTALDLGIMTDYLFAGGLPPCDPCAP